MDTCLWPSHLQMQTLDCARCTDHLRVHCTRQDVPRLDVPVQDALGVDESKPLCQLQRYVGHHCPLRSPAVAVQPLSQVLGPQRQDQQVICQPGIHLTKQVGSCSNAKVCVILSGLIYYWVKKRAKQFTHYMLVHKWLMRFLGEFSMGNFPQTLCLVSLSYYKPQRQW